MIPTIASLLEKARGVPSSPVAVEAYWDGDTAGWFVVLSLIYSTSEGEQDSYGEFELASLSGAGGDMRLFNGQVPPWPEAVHAQQVGRELATNLNVPFFFASPEHPEDDCPRWWQRGAAYSCRRCGVLLLQSEQCPWRGLCHHCHLDEKRQGSS